MVLNFLKSGYKKVRDALAKTRSMLGSKLRALFSGKTIDDATLEQLEQLFYEADLGLQTATELTQKIQEIHRKQPDMNPDALLAAIRSEMVAALTQHPNQLINVSKEDSPMVILIVGVNGNGKTTSVAKLAKYFQAHQKKVLIGGADTFRAAAMEQLETWAKRLDIDMVKGSPKSDPAAVAFDAVTAAKARQADVVIIDTAGRLHTKTDLMQELDKIKRTCKKVNPSSPHETLLVLDATTGQNAIDQAKTFNQFVPISGLILTKLDGTAKGGIVISIYRQLGIPVKFIGIGEGIDDLEPFVPENFVNALFE
jgi:fused signal recognition particle receptor